jgi:peptidoglycan/LPS O-acetylase OafA/YrhL
MALFSAVVLLAEVALGVSMANYFIRDPAALSIEQWIGNYSLTETFRPHLFGPRSNLLVDHYWTLNYELQFYAIVTLILLLARSHYYVIVALITAATVALQFSPPSIQKAVDGFIVWRYWLVFAAGILLYWQVNYATTLERWCCNAALLATLVIAAWDWTAMTSSEWSPRAAVAFTAGFTLLLANIVTWDRRIAGVRWLAPLAACGAISYSIYLTHPLIVRTADLLAEDWLGVSSAVKTIVVVPAVVLISIGAGWLFYWAVERHFTAVSAPAPRTLRAAGTPAVSKA